MATERKADNERWRAVRTRDIRANGSFVYAVKTTGVFCRPACASRLPRRENVLFFDQPAHAERAGFRACRRCAPMRALHRKSSAIVEACRLIERETAITNRALASRVSLSPEHLLRRFKREIGVTPQAYRRRVRAERGKRALRRATSVLEAAFDAGYGSSSRFYAGLSRELGMPVRSARRGASSVPVHYAVRTCSLGRVLVAWTDRGVCEVALGDVDAPLIAALRERFAVAQRWRKKLPAWASAVLRMAERPCVEDIPLDVRATAFQERVWSALRAIPLGETRSYAELARHIGAPRSVRAVARACATNSLALVIPCHRVVRADGAIAGYRWGKARKQQLLTRECAKRSSCFVGLSRACV